MMFVNSKNDCLMNDSAGISLWNAGYMLSFGLLDFQDDILSENILAMYSADKTTND
jgi:hypothetical protein